METSQGFSVRIFLPTGEPDGLRIIGKSNWTGQGLVFPRTRFGEARKRGELKRAGVYVLWGPDENDLFPQIYVGEGEEVLPRLDQHAKDKDFWTHAVVFTSMDQNLNKAYVKYLEARLVAQAQEVKRAKLKNENTPKLPVLSEADVTDADGFFRDMLLCLPVVGVNFFETVKVPEEQNLILEAKGIVARGQDTAEGFVVRVNSQAVKKETNSIPDRLKERRQFLLTQGVLEEVGTVYRLTQDYLFESSSMAAGVLLGSSINGLRVWKDSNGRTLKKLRESAAT